MARAKKPETADVVDDAATPPSTPPSPVDVEPMVEPMVEQAQPEQPERPIVGIVDGREVALEPLACSVDGWRWYAIMPGDPIPAGATVKPRP